MADNELNENVIIDLSNLQLKVTEIGGKVEGQEARAKLLAERVRQSENDLARVEHKAMHIAKHLGKQFAKMAALQVVEGVTDNIDLPGGGRALVNLGFSTIYGAMSMPGMPLAGAALGLGSGAIHILMHMLNEHDDTLKRMKEAQQKLAEEQDALENRVNERFMEHLDELKKQFDEAYEKLYDEMHGLAYDSWVESEN